MTKDNGKRDQDRDGANKATRNLSAGREGGRSVRGGAKRDK